MGVGVGWGGTDDVGPSTRTNVAYLHPAGANLLFILWLKKVLRMGQMDFTKMDEI